jgi:hypothetical protein
MAKDIKNRGTSLCLGCLDEVKHTELRDVTMFTGDVKFTSIFCEKCIKKKNFPENDKVEIGNLVTTPKKKVIKKKVTKKKPYTKKKIITKKKPATKKKVTPNTKK